MKRETEIETKPESENVQREEQQSKIKINTKSVGIIPCGCGKCGKTISAVDK